MSDALSRDYAHYRRVFEGRRMPFAFVDLELFDANVDAIAQRAKGRPIRVASKSVRCPALLKRIFDRNPLYKGIMSYSARETCFLFEQGFDDFLMGYPIWNANDVRDICAVVSKGASITLMVDAAEQAAHLNGLAAEAGVTLRVCIDLDMSSSFPGMHFPGLHFGVRRSPITKPEQAVALARVIAEQPHLELAGLMGYEAQIAGVPDNAPGGGAKNAVIRFLKRRSIAEIAKRRTDTVKALRAAGFELPLVNGGGTGSVESTLEEDHITEVTVGSGFFSPVLFDGYTAFKHLPAVGYAIEVTRKPIPGVYTCSGGGYIASGGTGPDKQPKPYLPEGASLLGLEGAGEVQTPIQYDGPETLDYGDPVFMRYSKAGEMCERFNALLAVEGGKVIEEYPTYRGLGHHFL